jgi:hypothetical protein
MHSSSNHCSHQRKGPFPLAELIGLGSVLQISCSRRRRVTCERAFFAVNMKLERLTGSDGGQSFQFQFCGGRKRMAGLDVFRRKIEI